MPKRIPLVLLLPAPLAKIATAPRLNKTPSHQLKTFFPLIPRRLVAWIGEMKATLFVAIVGLLLVGCEGEEIIKDGPYTEYHENGQKAEEGYYKDGKFDGLTTWWFENRQKKAENAGTLG